MYGIMFVESFTGDYEDFVACWCTAEVWEEEKEDEKEEG